MSNLQKNVASQNMTFGLVNVSTGAALVGATVAVFVVKDNGAQASGTGTVTGCGNGQYNYAPTQAETNATDVGFLFTATNAIPVNYDFHTDVVDANGLPSVNMTDIAGQTVTAAAGVTFPSSIASPTNITAGTITTVSGNVNGSVGSVFGAVGSVTGNVGGSIGGSVVGSVGSVVATVTANTTQLAGQTVTAAAGVTFPTSVASPTNITAGTITTVTNLTNAPTAGDFTATMKTSLNAQTVTTVTGNVNGSVGSVTGSVTVGTNNDKTGYALTAGANTAIATSVLTSTMTESYSTKGSAFTLTQGVYDMHQLMLEQSIAGTTLTAKKRDQATTAKTGTLDSATSPASITEAS